MDYRQQQIDAGDSSSQFASLSASRDKTRARLSPSVPNAKETAYAWADKPRFSANVPSTLSPGLSH